MELRALGNTGELVSALGFGAATLGDEYGRITEEDGIGAVHAAVDAGVTFIDVAPYYGRTLAEERLGKALVGRRDEVFLATKCARYGLDDFDFSAARVTSSIDESLRRLRTDRVDLYQVHDIEFGDRRQVIEEAIPAAREVVKSGKARFVGITGLPIHYLRSVADEAPVDTVLSYAHLNLMMDDLNDVLVPFCGERGIGLINASVLHMGVLTEKGPPDWHLGPKEALAVGPKVAALCREHGRNVSEVALRYCLDQPGVATTVCGMSSPAEVEQNLRALEQRSDPHLLKKIESLIAPVKNRTWRQGREENNPSHPADQETLIKSSVTLCLAESLSTGPWVFWHDLGGSCARAAELGFDGVELFHPAPDALDADVLARELDQHRLSLAAVGTGAGKVLHGWSLIDPDETVRARAREFIAGMIDFGARFGAPAIVGSMQGRIDGKVEREQALDWLRDALGELGRRAGDHGTFLIYETLNQGESDVLNTLADGAAMIDSLGGAAVKLLADLYHLHIEETSVDGAIREPRRPHRPRALLRQQPSPGRARRGRHGGGRSGAARRRLRRLRVGRGAALPRSGRRGGPDDAGVQGAPRGLTPQPTRSEARRLSSRYASRNGIPSRTRSSTLAVAASDGSSSVARSRASSSCIARTTREMAPRQATVRSWARNSGSLMSWKSRWYPDGRSRTTSSSAARSAIT